MKEKTDFNEPTGFSKNKSEAEFGKSEKSKPSSSPNIKLDPDSSTENQVSIYQLEFVVGILLLALAFLIFMFKYFQK